MPTDCLGYNRCKVCYSHFRSPCWYQASLLRKPFLSISRDPLQIYKFLWTFSNMHFTISKIYQTMSRILLLTFMNSRWQGWKEREIKAIITQKNAWGPEIIDSWLQLWLIKGNLHQLLLHYHNSLLLLLSPVYLSPATHIWEYRLQNVLLYIAQLPGDPTPHSAKVGSDN